jgi:hypothetical protein
MWDVAAVRSQMAGDGVERGREEAMAAAKAARSARQDEIAAGSGADTRDLGTYHGLGETSFLPRRDHPTQPKGCSFGPRAPAPGDVFFLAGRFPVEP